MSRLAALLRRRHVGRLLLAVLLGRLPEGMVPLGIVLLVREGGGSFGLAGLLAGLLAVGAAVGGPPLGRLIDRRGQPAVLLTAGAVRALAVAGLTAAGAGAPVAAAACALLCGLSTPPLEPALRAIWADVTEDAAQAEAAFRLEAGLQELIFVFGPLVLTLLVLASGPGAALLATAAIGIAGAALYASVPPVRAWRGAPRTDAHWAAALRAPGIPALLVVALAVGAVIGCVNVAAPAFAERTGIEPGWLLAAYAFGGLLGGTVAAAREPAREVEALLPWLLVALGLLFVPALAAPAPVAMALVLAAGGATMAPALASAFIVIGRRALTGALAETFAWFVSGVLVGIAAGSALAGQLAEGGDARGFVVAVAAGLTGAAVWAAADRQRSVPARRWRSPG